VKQEGKDGKVGKDGKGGKVWQGRKREGRQA
jgi:hypothetical protein